MKEGHGNHLAPTHTGNTGQGHVDGRHARCTDWAKRAEQTAEEGREGHGCEFAQDIGEQGYRGQLRGQLFAERIGLQFGYQDGRQRIVPHTAAHGKAVHQSPFGNAETHEYRKEQTAQDGAQGNEQHPRPKQAHNLPQVVAATDADAHLKHQGIQYIYGRITYAAIAPIMSRQTAQQKYHKHKHTTHRPCRLLAP